MFNHYYSFDTSLCDTSVAFGRFDGMHTGHRAVLKELALLPNSVLISFSKENGEVIYTEAEKEFVLKRENIGNMISVSSDILEQMELAAFVEDYLAGRLGARVIVTGENYEKLTELKELCRRFNIDLKIVRTVNDDGREVTTDLVAEYINDKNADEAIRLMGGCYVLKGSVVHGKGVGKVHGMPTANLSFLPNKIWPKHGVYASRVFVSDECFNGMTNVGFRPSDDDVPVATCETYILDFDRDIYGREIVLELYDYIRPVMKFPNLDALKEQIDKDINFIALKYECVI